MYLETIYMFTSMCEKYNVFSAISEIGLFEFIFTFFLFKLIPPMPFVSA